MDQRVGGNRHHCYFVELWAVTHTPSHGFHLLGVIFAATTTAIYTYLYSSHSHYIHPLEFLEIAKRKI